MDHITKGIVVDKSGTVAAKVEFFGIARGASGTFCRMPATLAVRFWYRIQKRFTVIAQPRTRRVMIGRKHCLAGYALGRVYPI